MAGKRKKHGHGRAKTPGDMDSNLPQAVSMNGELLPPVPRPGSLANVRSVRRELSRVYRDTRVGKLHPDDLGKLTYALNALSKVIELETFESRLKAVEEKITTTRTP